MWSEECLAVIMTKSWLLHVTFILVLEGDTDLLMGLELP